MHRPALGPRRTRPDLARSLLCAALPLDSLGSKHPPCCSDSAPASCAPASPSPSRSPPTRTTLTSRSPRTTSSPSTTSCTRATAPPPTTTARRTPPGAPSSAPSSSPASSSSRAPRPSSGPSRPSTTRSSGATRTSTTRTSTSLSASRSRQRTTRRAPPSSVRLRSLLLLLPLLPSSMLNCRFPRSARCDTRRFLGQGPRGWLARRRSRLCVLFLLPSLLPAQLTPRPIPADDNTTEYLSDKRFPYFGAVVGRVANRIANGASPPSHARAAPLLAPPA